MAGKSTPSRRRPTPSEVARFLHKLIALTEAEATLEAAETSLLHASTPLSLLVLKGLALSPLTATKTSIGLGGRTLVELEKSSEVGGELGTAHGFRNGDAVELSDAGSGSRGKSGKTKEKGKEKDSGEGDKIEGVVWRVQESKIVISIGKSSSSPGQEELELPSRIKLLKTANPTTTNRQISTLTSLLRTLDLPLPSTSESIPPSLEMTPPPTKLISVLLGLEPPSSPPATSKLEPLSFYDEQLNESQRQAVEFVLRGSGEIALVWGPPGTGKTQTLVEIVRQYLLPPSDTPHRILIVGSSNLATDNLLLRLSHPLPFTPPIPLTRIGHPARVMSSLTRHTLDAQSSGSETAELLGGIKEELGSLEGMLRGMGGKGGKGVISLELKLDSKGRLRGKERQKAWDEVRALRKEFRKREGGVVKEVLGKAKIVLATCHGAGSRSLEKEEFDIVIIDEAAQCVEPGAWIPVLKKGVGKLILAGDHKQLPPTVRADTGGGKKEKKLKSEGPKSKAKSEPKAAAEKVPPSEKLAAVDLAASSPPTSSVPLPSSIPSAVTSLPPPTTLSTTLFERLLALHGPSIRVMLNTQYRFNDKIMEFPSKRMYDGELVSGEGVGGRRLGDLVVDVEGGGGEDELGEEVVFIDTAGSAMYERLPDAASGKLDAESKSNENEAALVVKYVESLIAAKILPSAIAIISPYNAQVQLLGSLIHPTYPEIEIGSIDGFQGREQEVVIISLVRSNEEGEVGFLKDDRRLNVAMTRPKRQLVVVGDSETVSKGGGFLKDWMEWLEENAEVRVVEP
ncbi:DNA helicase [Pseudohyphozyma bogoriensis]|nr:DNA helicase [Pseudohyphozyma bogoriensis]